LKGKNKKAKQGDGENDDLDSLGDLEDSLEDGVSNGGQIFNTESQPTQSQTMEIDDEQGKKNKNTIKISKKK